MLGRPPRRPAPTVNLEPQPSPFHVAFDHRQGPHAGLNYRTMGWITLGWAATFVVSGLACALIFVQGAYAPYVYDTIDLDLSPGV